MICNVLLGEETFDPKARKFSEDELKPQPMIKKSRKVGVLSIMIVI